MSSNEFAYYFDPEELEPFGEASSAPRAGVAPLRATISRPTQQNVAAVGVSTTPQLTVPRPPRDAEICSSGTLKATQRRDLNPAGEPTAPAPRTKVRQLVSVHALGQFVFCARSAILAAERGDESEEEEAPLRLGYLPNYDLARIEEALAGSMRLLWVALLAICCLTGAMTLAVAESRRLLFYPAFTLCLVCLTWLLHLASVVLELWKRRREALRAEARDPDPLVEGITNVNWWSLLKAGFESVSYERPFRHPDLPLEGRPWRVLERGSLRIPVLRSGSDRLGDRHKHVFGKHQIRLAAYAILLESTGQINVPYGLVLPANSCRGAAVPITRTLRDEARQRLADFSRLLRQSQNGESDPRPPRDCRRCEKCPHGQPLAITKAEIDGMRRIGRPLIVLQQRNGRQFYTVCGNRFGSTPPHAQVAKLGLTVQPE